MSDQLIPASIADERMKALDRLAAERFAALSTAAVIVYVIDSVDASALPVLAWQFGALGDTWHLTTDDSARRALLKRTIIRRRHRGTDFAVWDALDAAGITNRVTPSVGVPFLYDGTWRHNGGNRHRQPPLYVFWVVVVGEPSSEQLDAINKTIVEWKRLSARFEVFWVDDESGLNDPGVWHVAA
jgi:hypothetical protein